MPSVTRRLTGWYSMKFPALHKHNQPELGRQVLRSSFYVRVLTQVQSSLCSDYRLHLVGYLYSNRLGFPLTFTEFLAQSTNTTQQTFLVQGTDVLWQPHFMWIVLWSNATSSVFFTVSHQNGFSSSIQSASNLHLVSNHNFRCLRYLCSQTVFCVF